MSIRRYGWSPDLPDIRDLSFSARRDTVTVDLPRSMDLRPHCPPVVDQGQLGSCTANAIAGAFDYERVQQGFVFMHPSRLFIYYNERAYEGTIESDAGAQIRDGFKVINKHGVCFESQWPYDISKFADRPWPKCYATAKKDRCLQYLSVAQDFQSTRQCLAERFPFVFGFTVYESFESDAVARSGIVPMPGQTERVVGGHAVVAVGYDDARQMFLCRNSWGVDWGIGGYFWIPYAYLASPSLASDFWTIRLVTA